jgi:hypothetical protein
MRKWYSVTEYVNIDTGEVISKSDVERGRFIRSGHDENVEHFNNYSIKKRLNYVKKNPQIRLFE